VVVQWAEGKTDVRCPVCGRAHDQGLLGTSAVHWRDDPVAIARCGDCGAVVLGDVMPPTQYQSSDVDRYIEDFASIQDIATLLAKTGAGAGARMLDVGCAYGFGVDVGQFLFDWKAIGLDPSVAAVRGSDELGLEIRAGTLADAFAPGERFDVIFSSEVLEHVSEPRAFLGAIRELLSERGIFLVTTPDAAVVDPRTPTPALHAVLSVGAHEFLVDGDGLERLLNDAGFVANVWHEGVALRALAASSEDVLRAARPNANVRLNDVIRYCDARAETAPAGSSLAVGMANRYVMLCVNAGRLRKAARGLPRLHRAVQKRYGIDVNEPTAQIPVDPPIVLVGVHYFTGLVTGDHRRDLRAAIAHFEASAAIAQASFDWNSGYIDPHTPLLEARAIGERAVALARVDPAAVPAALEDLDRGVTRGVGDAALVENFRTRVRAEQSAVGRAGQRMRRMARRTRDLVRHRG
jgi:SAM-dependent methyltransferase